jgi:WD40 repeat protein
MHPQTSFKQTFSHLYQISAIWNMKIKVFLYLALLFCTLLSACDSRNAAAIKFVPAQQTTSTPDLVLQPTAIETLEVQTDPLCIETYMAPIGFMPDSQRILVRGESGVKVFNLATMQEEIFLESRTQPIRPNVALALNGETLAWALEDNSIQLIRLEDKRIIYTANIHSGPITKLKFVPNGLNLLSASHDGWVKELNSDGELVNEFQPGGGEILGLGISADGTLFATLPFDGPVWLWNRDSFQMAEELGGTGGFDTSDAAFSTNGKYLAADLATGLAIWDIADQSLLWDGINSMAFAFSPVDDILAYSDINKNNNIILISPDGKQVLKELSGHQGPVLELIFSPDGQLLASTDGIDLRIWRVDDGELLFIGKSNCP